MRRYIISAALVALVCVVGVSAQSVRSPYDASAARKTLSNVNATTGRTALGVAASSATVLTSGANAMTGNLRFSGNYGVLQSTNDGADNSQVYICGGGQPSGNVYDRGATVIFSGNEYATGGLARYYAGNVSTGDHIFYTGAAAERMRVTYGGNLLIGTTTDDGANKLQVNGSVAISSFMQLASPTAIPAAAAGRIYFNGTEAKFKKCLNGSTWVDM